jgi:predicted nucleic acid-binding protein
LKDTAKNNQHQAVQQKKQHRTTTEQPMKKLLAFFMIIAAGIYGVNLLITLNKTADERQNMRWALISEKNSRYDDVIWNTVKTLEKNLESIEKKTGLKTVSIIEERCIPAVFRDRLNESRGDKDQLLNDVNETLYKVIFFRHIADTRPSLDKHDLARKFESTRYENTSEAKEIIAAATKEYNDIIVTQNAEIEKIKALTPADVPEYQVAWQREISKELEQ